MSLRLMIHCDFDIDQHSTCGGLDYLPASSTSSVPATVVTELVAAAHRKGWELTPTGFRALCPKHSGLAGPRLLLADNVSPLPRPADGLAVVTLLKPKGPNDDFPA